MLKSKMLVNLPVYLQQDIGRYARANGMTDEQLIETACLQFMTQCTLNVRIRDKEAFEAVDCARLSEYAKSKGWRFLEAIPSGFADVYTRKHNKRMVELVVPTTTKVGDYAARIGDCIELLAKVERRSELAVYFDVHVRGGRPWLQPHAARI